MNPTPFEEIDSYILEMDRADALDQILGILKKQVLRIGFEKFTYWLLWPSEGPRVPLYLTSYPTDWTKHYLKSDFKSHDIIANCSAVSFRPFLWSDVRNRLPLTKAQKLVFEDGNDFGLKCGGSIPIHGPKDAKATFTVASDVSEQEFEKLFLARRHELQLIATYAHEKIMLLGLDKVPTGSIKLTPREIEVLTWSARGKTRWEIGVILRISEDTVKKHIENASQKLDASNKTHAIAVAIVHGLIIP